MVRNRCAGGPSSRNDLPPVKCSKRGKKTHGQSQNKNELTGEKSENKSKLKKWIGLGIANIQPKDNQCANRYFCRSTTKNINHTCVSSKPDQNSPTALVLMWVATSQYLTNKVERYQPLYSQKWCRHSPKTRKIPNPLATLRLGLIIS